MNRFLVYMPDGNSSVEENFPDHYYALEENLWVIATKLNTCADVYTKLAAENSKRSVIVKVDEFYGFYDRALWDKLNVWINDQ